ncbi:hypothetical protein Tco_0485297 [Tanacetum coccineum]
MGGDTHGKGSCFPITNPISDLKDTKVESGISTPGNNIISELFGISLKTYKDFEEFINNIELGKSEVWLELSEEQLLFL